MNARSWMAMLGICALPGLAAAMTLSSADIENGGPAPSAMIHPSCGGQNVSPELGWNGAPPGTRSFALTLIDHSVKPADWSHWIIVDIPPAVHAIRRGAGGLPAPAVGVRSNMRSDRYAGPCPPPGTGVHRYELTIWALPTAELEVSPDGPATQLEAKLKRASIAHASLTATAGR